MSIKTPLLLTQIINLHAKEPWYEDHQYWSSDTWMVLVMRFHCNHNTHFFLVFSDSSLSITEGIIQDINMNLLFLKSGSQCRDLQLQMIPGRADVTIYEQNILTVEWFPRLYYPSLPFLMTDHPMVTTIPIFRGQIPLTWQAISITTTPHFAKSLPKTDDGSHLLYEISLEIMESFLCTSFFSSESFML